MLQYGYTITIIRFLNSWSLSNFDRHYSSYSASPHQLAHLPPVFLQEREAKEAQAGDVLNVESEAALREEKVGRMGISKTMQKSARQCWINRFNYLWLLIVCLVNMIFHIWYLIWYMIFDMIWYDLIYIYVCDMWKRNIYIYVFHFFYPTGQSVPIKHLCL